MNKKLRETTNLGAKRLNSKESRRTNSRLPFDVNVMVNLRLFFLVHAVLCFNNSSVNCVIFTTLLEGGE